MVLKCGSGASMGLYQIMQLRIFSSVFKQKQKQWFYVFW